MQKINKINSIADIDEKSLVGNIREYRELSGPDVLGRVQPFLKWQDLLRANGLWQFGKMAMRAPLEQTAILYDNGVGYEGVNFASQDYLSLSSHPALKQAAIDAAQRFGVHSAGSGALLGSTTISRDLELLIGEFLETSYVSLFPTGWGAGFGVIKGLIRPNDHIILDGLAHACLQEGAAATTSNVHLHGHLKISSVETLLRRIRSKDQHNAILIVTESLFSMDSDVPDIVAMQELAHKYDAFLLVDCAHDLGALGPGGRGNIAVQGMLGKIDIVMGSFSKTFGSNGGFVATQSRAVKEYLRMHSGPHTFSNALSPIQAAVVKAAFEIADGSEGQTLRNSLMNNVLRLRKAISAHGLECMGEPSAIVPVFIGDEGVGRISCRIAADHGAITNMVEFPGVARGRARFRLQVQASHTYAQVDKVAAILNDAIQLGKSLMPALVDEAKLTLSGTDDGVHQSVDYGNQQSWVEAAEAV